MGQGTPMQLTKIKKIVAEIKEFPAQIDSIEQAKNARHLLKKYAVLSEKIERNILITTAHREDLAKIRTEEFKAIRRSLKEKANLNLHSKSKKTQSEKPGKKAVKAPTPKKISKTAGESVVAKETSSKTVKKSSSPKKPKTTRVC